mmetsp:Transcript_48067/g.65451  ORF Transcript_48067/g.65451 Transcript_48067/m.65451 type:complete len:119 (-) Transcript_48067:644-1000(-)
MLRRRLATPRVAAVMDEPVLGSRSANWTLMSCSGFVGYLCYERYAAEAVNRFKPRERTPQMFDTEVIAFRLASENSEAVKRPWSRASSSCRKRLANSLSPPPPLHVTGRATASTTSPV